MKSSILSYPNRGKWGNNRYRGNTTGHVIRELLEYYRPAIFVDPFLGGNTSFDVVRDFQNDGASIEFHGFDLHSGFNILTDSLADRIGGERADLIFAHPAYFNLIRYSGKGNMWGDSAHPDDISHSSSYEDFLMKMRISLQNIYDAVRAGKHFSVLIGDIRQNGKFTSIQADLIQLAPGELESIVIKAQHNCTSDNRAYAGKFVPIHHEYLLNFRKNLSVFGMLESTLEVSSRLHTLAKANWRATVYTALKRLGGRASNAEIYSVIEASSPDVVRPRPHWRERVRCELQRHFKSVERGVWEIPGFSEEKARFQEEMPLVA